MAAREKCCVQGCERTGKHRRRFTLARDDWGEVEVDAFFCCDHLDMWQSADKPFIDLEIVGVERG